MKKSILLLNGSSGTGRIREICFDLIEQLYRAGYRTEVCPVIPEDSQRINEFLNEKGPKCDLLVCAGGDGTLFHLVNTLMKMKKQPVIGYLPTGSTNDFARGIEIPTDLSSACRILTEGKPFAYDVGCLNGTYYNYVAAFGAFAAVSYSTDQDVKNVLGHTAYTINGLSHLGENLNYRTHLKIKADHFQAEGDYLFGAIYNSISIGGFVLSPENTPDNGKFDIMLIKAPDNIAEASSIFGALANKEIDRCPEILHREVSSAEILFDRPTKWTLDGEYGGIFDRASFSVASRAVTIMVSR